MSERRMLEMTFNDVEALLERLNAARQSRMRGLAEYVETLSACASGEQQPNAYLPPPDRTPLLLRQMFWALESVKRGESGAAGEFVRTARNLVPCFESNRAARENRPPHLTHKGRYDFQCHAPYCG
jgi:hypothetical protein